MRLLIALLVALSSSFVAGNASAAISRCYLFHNETSHDVRLDFTPNLSSARAISSKTLASHAKPWSFCVNDGPSVVISVTVSGGGTASWTGVLQMSTGSTGHPAGDYYIR
jgi:hypothetical protein